MKKSSRKRGIAGLAMAGSMFLGMGIGHLAGNFQAGLFIGIGIGLASMAVISFVAAEEEREANI